MNFKAVLALLKATCSAHKSISFIWIVWSTDSPEHSICISVCFFLKVHSQFTSKFFFINSVSWTCFKSRRVNTHDFLVGEVYTQIWIVGTLISRTAGRKKPNISCSHSIVFNVISRKKEPRRSNFWSLSSKNNPNTVLWYNSIFCTQTSQDKKKQKRDTTYLTATTSYRVSCHQDRI